MLRPLCHHKLCNDAIWALEHNGARKEHPAWLGFSPAPLYKLLHDPFCSGVWSLQWEIELDKLRGCPRNSDVGERDPSGVVPMHCRQCLMGWSEILFPQVDVLKISLQLTMTEHGRQTELLSTLPCYRTVSDQSL